jgi:16S rRNA (guanine966-N2)-methyltransferase
VTSGRFRIIAGQWRGRRLTFPALDGVRPTADRVRETVFNWLAPVIAGSRCLDLFAGSGALGLEALSRGAASVTFVDREPRLIRAVVAHLDILQCDAGSALCADASTYLAGKPGPFDIIFVDPPFGSGSLGALCQMISDNEVLSPGGRVYLEQPASAAPPNLPPTWEMLRSARAGNVGYHLAASPSEAGENKKADAEQEPT